MAFRREALTLGPPRYPILVALVSVPSFFLPHYDQDPGLSYLVKSSAGVRNGPPASSPSHLNPHNMPLLEGIFPRILLCICHFVAQKNLSHFPLLGIEFPNLYSTTLIPSDTSNKMWASKFGKQRYTVSLSWRFITLITHVKVSQKSYSKNPLIFLTQPLPHGFDHWTSFSPKTYQPGACFGNTDLEDEAQGHSPTMQCPGDLCREQVLRSPPWITVEGNTTADCLLKVSWALPTALACGAYRKMLFSIPLSGQVLFFKTELKPCLLPWRLSAWSGPFSPQCPCCLSHLNTHLGTLIAALNYYINLILQHDFHFCTVTSASLCAQGRNLWKAVFDPHSAFPVQTFCFLSPGNLSDLWSCMNYLYFLRIPPTGAGGVYPSTTVKETSKCHHWLWNNPDSLLTSPPAPFLSEQVLLPLLLAKCGPQQKWISDLFDLYH